VGSTVSIGKLKLTSFLCSMIAIEVVLTWFFLQWIAAREDA
jgi:hypothetical protein